MKSSPPPPPRNMLSFSFCTLALFLGGGGGGFRKLIYLYLCMNLSVEGGQTQSLSSPYVILPLIREIPLGSLPPPLHALIIFSPS
jgi:hypothetical protein